MADTFFVGLTGSDQKIAAVTLCMPAFLVLSALANLFGVGGASHGAEHALLPSAAGGGPVAAGQPWHRPWRRFEYRAGSAADVPPSARRAGDPRRGHCHHAFQPDLAALLRGSAVFGAEAFRPILPSLPGYAGGGYSPERADSRSARLPDDAAGKPLLRRAGTPDVSAGHRRSGGHRRGKKR